LEDQAEEEMRRKAGTAAAKDWQRADRFRRALTAAVGAGEFARRSGNSRRGRRCRSIHLPARLKMAKKIDSTNTLLDLKRESDKIVVLGDVEVVMAERGGDPTI
jgi:hypothetical protein